MHGWVSRERNSLSLRTDVGVYGVQIGSDRSRVSSRPTKCLRGRRCGIDTDDDLHSSITLSRSRGCFAPSGWVASMRRKPRPEIRATVAAIPSPAMAYTITKTADGVCSSMNGDEKCPAAATEATHTSIGRIQRPGAHC